MANFVLVPATGLLSTKLGYLEFMPAMVATAAPSASFRYAFGACAYASLHNRYGPSAATSHNAQRCYAQALRATTTALQDERTARQDHTLAAVLLLCHFEHITARSLNMQAWDLHVGAAIELAKLRGSGQVATEQGLALFTAVRTQMVSFGRLFLHRLVGVIRSKHCFVLDHTLS